MLLIRLGGKIRAHDPDLTEKHLYWILFVKSPVRKQGFSHAVITDRMIGSRSETVMRARLAVSDDEIWISPLCLVECSIYGDVTFTKESLPMLAMKIFSSVG